MVFGTVDRRARCTSSGSALIDGGTSNGVNVTDGLDGLAAGASILAIGSFVIIGFWQFNQSCFSENLNPERRVPRATTCATRSTSRSSPPRSSAPSIGFLWWNTHPAQIYMGDTGSLALGGALAALAILSHTELLAAPHRRPLRHRDRLGHRAARVLQAHAAASASS